MTYFMGIDGGGSNLRVVITSRDLNVISQAYRLTANPSIIGRSKSAMVIQSTMREAIAQARLRPSEISGVCIGVAGASAEHSRDWLLDTVSSVIPTSCVVPSSDNEIALVGAHGQRRGVLILAGTGSVAFAINPAGQRAQAGGWGYLIGDEGSAYWIGKRALQMVTRSVDGRLEQTELVNAMLRVLNLGTPKELIGWLYQETQPRTRDIALLARLVIDIAESGDRVAQGIINEAADELAALGQAVMSRLNFGNAPIAFAGGLLEKSNYLSNQLVARLGLSEIPLPKYSPVIGAALLAQMEAGV